MLNDLQAVEFKNGMDAMQSDIYDWAIRKGWYDCKKCGGTHLIGFDGHDRIECDACRPITVDGKRIYVDNRNFGELLMLAVSELSEALEHSRDPKRYLNETWMLQDGKPDGVPIELADCMIRLFDLAAHFNINLADAILAKMKYNETRPYRHGNKKS